MKTGRPSSRPRPPFGQRLHHFRELAGLTQAQVAQALGISTRAYAFWEREPVAIKPEQFCALADVLKVSLDELVGHKAAPKRTVGPAGKLQKVFQRANSLPRAKQAVIAEVVDAYVTQQGVG